MSAPIDPKSIRVGDRVCKGSGWVTVVDTSANGPSGLRLTNQNGTAGGWAFGGGYATRTFTDHTDDPFIRAIERLDVDIVRLKAERANRIHGLGVVEVEVIAYDPDEPPLAAVLPEGQP